MRRMSPVGDMKMRMNPVGNRKTSSVHTALKKRHSRERNLFMKANERQIDNLVSLLDGYVAEGGHHLNVNVCLLYTSLVGGVLRNLPAFAFLAPH